MYDLLGNGKKPVWERQSWARRGADGGDLTAGGGLSAEGPASHAQESERSHWVLTCPMSTSRAFHLDYSGLVSL